jgi:uncharacterized protein (TIGR02452 family)
MIKRNGVEIANQRTSLTKVAHETLEALKNGSYKTALGEQIDIRAQLDAAIAGTVYYPEDMPDKDYVAVKPVIEVVNETTAQAATCLIYGERKTDVVALNFANATNEGGGFLTGSVAQEEDLCRCSGLYPCLKSQPKFYADNRANGNQLYTDGIIYSPKVPFIRNSYGYFVPNPFELSIITAPAPCLRAMDANTIDWITIQHVIQYRAIKILQVAEAHGHRTIILGAWGCGAFGNDPKMVAEAFMYALGVVPTFERVVFAVYDQREPPVVYETFKEVIEGYNG